MKAIISILALVWMLPHFANNLFSQFASSSPPPQQNGTYIASISDVSFYEDNGYGCLSVQLYNHSTTETVTGYQVKVRCYDAQGELFESFGETTSIYSGSAEAKPLSFYPGLFDSGGYWPLGRLDEKDIVYVEVALYSYETKQGEVVEIPDADLVWLREERTG